MNLERAIAPLEQGYADLLARVREVVEGDQRLVGLWLSGSAARGVADAGSDLDLIVTAADEAFDAVAAAGETLWHKAIDPVITFEIPSMPGSFAFTTRDGLRCDIVVERAADLADTPYRRRLPIVGDTPVPDAPSDPGPDRDLMEWQVTDFLRQQAIFPAAIVAREDWLLGRVGVQNVHRMLYLIFVEANRPLPAMGVKQWSAKLTPAQAELLAALPLPSADRDSVIAAMRAAREAMLTHGRAAYESAGGSWPAEAADAIEGYWRRHGLAT
ncbi:nucleotidyltransferase domain-containing protein [Calidifontibacter sp. DB0510]|uniref:Nucleotidyltransferase domain-containing protein n=1 Tax=Metallococcus carri TaxID=1656884 RepID=A0A967EET1_9MICO|nr:nucleotidyltransferase domain-containing protein [Metallococcus carri]NHN55966.1 nucleotidyltransferase domain-containing protein [Metallococcus carri]NOP37577.1 nucleotidyltransferase domain-containing protein [Calidifontibacter sp. DB2511S]